MADPYHHAVSSVRKWGGAVEDYSPIHNWFDQTKAHFVDPRHRALRHHSEGIALMISIFGPTLELSTCKQCGEPRGGALGPHSNETALADEERFHEFRAKVIPTRWVGEQHVSEDFGHIPTAADFLRCMTTELWMVKGARRLSEELERDAGTGVTSDQVLKSIELAKREILEDITSGRVPATVASFSELHDYVDANEYGGLCDDALYADFDTSAANRVQDAVDAWLRRKRFDPLEPTTLIGPTFYDHLEHDYLRVIEVAPDGQLEIATSNTLDGEFLAGAWFSPHTFSRRLAEGSIAEVTLSTIRSSVASGAACPACGSTDTYASDLRPLGGTVRCNGCGNWFTPDGVAVTDRAHFVASFIPEAWVNDNAIEVDASGPRTWEADGFIREEIRTRGLRKTLDWLTETIKYNDRDDVLRDDPNAPAWVREWHGPFTIHLERTFNRTAKRSTRIRKERT